ncbi:unnamed protein product [Schistosoma turkestanicum]|nr:unnamed protein product [Schistosoma turkestanicum]
MKHTDDPPSTLCIRDDSRKLLDPNSLVELAHYVESASSFVSANACSQLRLIVEEMQHLKSQARAILQNAHRDIQLHKLPCNFLKKPGNVYYVYEKSDSSQYFSLLSPTEWDGCPHKYIGAYKLLPDMSWISKDDLDTYESNQNAALQMINKRQIMMDLKNT